MLFIFVLMLPTICTAFFEDKEPIMFPNERTTLNDCHLRYFKLHRGQVGPPHGTAARFREFAHMAAIGWTDLTNGTVVHWQCGGSLIWDNFVLTAAHCVVDSRGRTPDVVRLGDLDLFTELDDEHAQQFGIAGIIRHPEHRFAARYHDIALLKLDRSVRFDLTVSPACLWADEEVRFPSLTATGWGNTGFAMRRTPNLLKVTLKPIDNQQCSEVYPSGDRKLRSGLQDQHICAVDEKMDTCEGDSGGPLQVKLLHNSRMSSFLVGITSFGLTCGTSHPGVYTRVSFYHDWILSTMRNNGAAGIEENYNATFCALRFAEYREFDDNVIVRQTDTGIEIDGAKVRIYENTTPEQMVQIGWHGKAPDCYGVIIDEDTVLTVADCTEFEGKSPQYITYLKTRRMTISSIHVHPDHARGSGYNNIAILKTSQLLELPWDFQPTCIWHEPHFAGSVLAYGRGRRDINRYGSSMLDPTESYHLIQSPVQNESSCIISKQFDHRLANGLASEHFCVGNYVFQVPGSCNQLAGSIFDSILFKENNDYHHTMALSLLGRDCGFGEHLIGTRLASHVEWMKSVLLPGYQEPKAVLRYVDPDLREGDLCEDHGRCVLLDKCTVSWRKLGTFCGNSSVVCCPVEKAAKPSLIHQEFLGCPKLIRNLPRITKTGSIVQIGWTMNQTNHFYCSGAILNEVMIITTASCLGVKPPHVVSHHHTPYLYRVEAAMKHPAYNATSKNNDIALVLLKDALSWSSVLFPVCLWTNTTHTPIVLDMMFYDQTDALKLFTVHPMYNSDCQRTHPYRMSSSQLCVRDPSRNTTCVSATDQAIWIDPEGVPFLVGLTPHAKECTRWRYSVLTRISALLEWIGENVF